MPIAGVVESWVSGEEGGRGRTWSRADDSRAEVEAVSRERGDPLLVGLDEAFDEVEDDIAVDGLSQTMRARTMMRSGSGTDRQPDSQEGPCVP